MVANDRGQLVLVGAVAIAFIVVGIVVVFNGVVFTESTGDQGTVIDTKGGGSIGLSAERNVGEAAHAANRGGKFEDSADIDINEYIEPTQAPLATAEAESGGSLVNVEVIDPDVEEGYRAYQPNANNLTSDDISGSISGEQKNWLLTDRETEIDRFVLRVEPSASTGVASLGTVSDADTGVPDNPINTFDERLDIDASGSNVDLTGAVDGDCAGIEPDDDGFVTLQITRGIVLDQPDCSITLPSDETGPNGLGIESGDEVVGIYELVLADEPNTSLVEEEYFVPPSESQEPDQPNLSEIVWTAEYRITYDAGQVETEFEEEVDHYG